MKTVYISFTIATNNDDPCSFNYRRVELSEKSAKKIIQILDLESITSTSKLEPLFDVMLNTTQKSETKINSVEETPKTPPPTKIVDDLF